MNRAQHKRVRVRFPRNLNRKQVEAVLRNAARQKQVPVLMGKSMRGLDLSGIDFRNGLLSGADFRGTRLVGCRFSDADVVCANLRGTNLTSAVMVRTNLYNALFQGAVMSGTDLRYANLFSAELQDVQLEHADVAGARFGQTAIGGVDLSQILGLDKVIHVRPSLIGSDTLRLTANGLRDQREARQSEVFSFLRKAGVEEEFLSIMRTWIGKAVEFYSVFLSHSSLDNEFSTKLYEDLRSVGVNCWFDEKEIVPGDHILGRIDRAIRLWDKLILVCSKNSLSPKTGWWVEQELERALEKERELREKLNRIVPVLIPIRLDDYVFEKWSNSYKSSVTQRHIGDFRNWRNSQDYIEAFEKLRTAIDMSRAT